MADFDTGIEGYGNDVEISQNETGDAFLSLSVSNMTVEDIKNYIDYLAKASGYLTETEIEQKINRLAEAAGFLPVDQIQALVLTTIENAGALTAGNAEQLINAKVTQAILDLNDNLEYIQDVRNALTQQIDRVRSELRAVQTDNNQTYSEVQVLKNGLDSKIAGLKQGVNLLESLLSSIVQNKEIYNLLEVERSTRNSEISNVKSFIAEKETSLKTEVQLIYNQVQVLQERFTALRGNVDAETNSLETVITTKVDAFEERLDTINNTLTTLLNSGENLAEKLNILNNIDLTDSSNAFAAFQAEVETLRNEFSEYQRSYNEVIAEMGELTASLNEKYASISSEITGIATKAHELELNIGGKLDIEIDERKMQADTLIAEWAKFVSETEEKIVNLTIAINNFGLRIDEFPSKIEELLAIEAKSRRESIATLDTKLFREIELLRNEITADDAQARIENLRVDLKETKDDFNKRISDFLTVSVENLKQDISTTDSKIITVDEVLKGLIAVEASHRENKDIELQAGIDLANETRETRVQELTERFNELQTRFETLLASYSESGFNENINLSSLVDNLNSRYLALFNQVDQIQDKQSIEISTLRSEVISLGATLATIEQITVDNIQAEAEARVLSDNTLSDRIDTINTKFINLVGENTETISDILGIISDVDTELKQFKLNYDDNLRTELVAVYNSVNNLNDDILANFNAIKDEANLREAADLELDTKIQGIRNLFDPLKRELITDIDVTRSELQASITKVADDLSLEVQERLSQNALEAADIQGFKDEVNTKVDGLEEVVTDARSELTDFYENYENRVTNIETEVENNKTELSAAIANETQARVQADNDLRTALEAQAATIQSILATDSEVNLENLKAVLDIIKYITENPDANITAQLLEGLNTIENNLTELIQAEESGRVEAIDALRTELLNKASELQNSLNTIDARITNEIAAVNTTIDDKDLAMVERVLEVQNDLNTEIINRTAAEGTLQANIDAEKQRALDAETVLDTKISDEEEARTIADDALQVQIDSHLTAQVNVSNRVAVLEEKESKLMAGLPTNIKDLMDILDIINGNYTNVTTRIDAAVENASTRMQDIESSVQAEISARLLGDSNLNALIGSTRADLEAADANLQTAINTESQDRINADNGLQNQITNIVDVNTAQQDAIEANDNAISNEIADRIKHFNLVLSGQEGTADSPVVFADFGYQDIQSIYDIIVLSDSNKTRIGSLETNLAAEISTRAAKDTELDNKIISESNTRENADAAINTRIDTEVATLTSNINGVSTRVSTLEGTVASIMENADSTADSFAEVKAIIDSNKNAIETELTTTKNDLQSKINNNTTLIQTEESARISGDANLNTKIDQEISIREAADQDLQANLDNEATARSDADTALQTNINNEANARQAADASLQANIDALPKRFVDLLDVPDMSASQLYLVRVNQNGDGIEFVDHTTLIPQIRLDAKLETVDIVSTVYVIDDATGQETDSIEKINYVDGTYASYTYNTNGALSSIEYYDSSDTLLATKTFTYNANGRLDSVSWADA